jgi:hypothetical protein
MAAEPEKKIDKSLHAYGRKRREEAGEPLEVHPATRRMLQAEVAKLRAGKAETGRPWWRSLLLVWPRFGAAFAIFMMLAVCVWVFVQNENRKQGVTELAASHAPAADQPAVEQSVRLQEKLKAETDNAGALAGREEADAKKVSEKSPTRLAFDDRAKAQVRDAERNAPMPTGPSAELGKNVMLKLESPAQQPAKSDETLLTAAANDKRADLDGSARLLKQNSADGNRFYRQADASGVKLDDALAKGGLGVPPSSTVTAGVSLAAVPPTDAYLNFAYIETNFALVPSLGRLGANKPTTDSGVTTLGDVTAAPALQAATVTATEWAAADRQLRENEVLQSRGLNRAQEYERRDANGTPILQRFALEQINDRIRIRDGDGSVYEGSIVATTGVEALKESKDELRETQLQRKLSDPGTAGTPIQFRASGTNKARQLVVINGEMWRDEQLARSVKTVDALSAAAPKRVQAPAASSSVARTPAEPSPAEQSQGTRGRISGVAAAAGGTVNTASNLTNAFNPMTMRARVQIGRTNQVELNAVRTK